MLSRALLAALVLQLATRLAGYRMTSFASHWRAFLCMGLLNNVLPSSSIVWGRTEVLVIGFGIVLVDGRCLEWLRPGVHPAGRGA